MSDLGHDELHLIYYDFTSDDGRHYWECQTCSSAGSVPDHADAELAAEKAHGDQPCGRTSRRF